MGGWWSGPRNDVFVVVFVSARVDDECDSERGVRGSRSERVEKKLVACVIERRFAEFVVVISWGAWTTRGWTRGERRRRRARTGVDDPARQSGRRTRGERWFNHGNGG